MQKESTVNLGFKEKGLKFLRKNALLMFLMVAVAVIAFSEKAFFTSVNLLNILRQITEIGRAHV